MNGFSWMAKAVSCVCNVVTMLTNCCQIQWNQMKRICFFFSLAERLVLYRNAEKIKTGPLKWMNIEQTKRNNILKAKLFPLISSVSFFLFSFHSLFLSFFYSFYVCPFSLCLCVLFERTQHIIKVSVWIFH